LAVLNVIALSWRDSHADWHDALLFLSPARLRSLEAGGRTLATARRTRVHLRSLRRADDRHHGTLGRQPAARGNGAALPPDPESAAAVTTRPRTFSPRNRRFDGVNRLGAAARALGIAARAPGTTARPPGTRAGARGTA